MKLKDICNMIKELENSLKEKSGEIIELSIDSRVVFYERPFTINRYEVASISKDGKLVNIREFNLMTNARNSYIDEVDLNNPSNL